MRVMVFVKATNDSEAGILPPPELIEAMARFNDELTQAGILVAADGLKPTSAAKRVAFDGPERTVTDGPFGLARDLVAGYWIWEVADMDEAVHWAKRCPNLMPGPSEIDIRPFFDPADFEHLIPPEIRAIPDRAKRWEAVSAKAAAADRTDADV